MKKYFAFFTLNIMLLLFSVGVSSEGLYAQSGISFLPAPNSPILQGWSDVDGTIYAQATVENTSGLEKTAFLYLCKYKGNELKGISFGKETVSAASKGKNGQATITANIGVGSEEKEGYTYKAYIWDGALGLGACRQEAEFLNDNISLYGIKVGDKWIEDYKDQEDDYEIMVSAANEQIVLYPKNGGVMLNTDYNVPGKTVIKLSVGDRDRIITIKTSLDPEYNRSLSGVKYSYWDATEKKNVEKDVANFDYKETEYEVKLPDNTFYVRVKGTSNGEITYKVQDVDWYANKVGGVSFGKIRQDTTGPAYVYPRLAIDRVIPIKNEETKAIIEVKDGTKTKTYTITFYSKQPRLTEYQLTAGAVGDEYVPVFTSGAGLNNDNGSLISADRCWVAANISKSLIGASYFMSPHTNVNRNWWHNEGKEGDEYFHFKADTSGTLVAVCSDKFDMTAYKNEGWEKGGESMPEKFKGYSKQKVFAMNKADNDYDSPTYSFYGLTWKDGDRANELRANLGVEEITDENIKKDLESKIGDAYGYSKTWYRHFDADKEVVIRKTEVYDNNDNATAPEFVWAIIWDDIDVHYPTEEIKSESNDDVIVSYDYLNNTGSDTYNTYSTIWKNLGADSGDLELEDINEKSGWGVNGFVLSTPDTRLELLGGVKTALNSGDFTVEFEADDIDGNAAILTSKNDRFSICAEDGYVKVYLGSIAKNPISLPVTEVREGVNHIVVSFTLNAKKVRTAVNFKWYINGELKAEKNFIKFVNKDLDTVYLGSTKGKFYNGTASIKKLKIFNCAKTQDSIRRELGE